MSGPLIRHHDEFFKRLLDRPGAAAALLRERLPPEVAVRLAPDDPEALPGSFIRDDLREVRTDRLYRVRTTDGEAAFVYVLVEHKSRPDPRLGLQLLGYLAEIWREWDEREGRDSEGRRRRLPPVFPLVVYHGATPWTVPLAFADAIAAPAAWRPHLLDFRCAVVDLGRIADPELSRQALLRIGLLILKRGTSNGDLRRTLVELGRAALALGLDELVALLRYILVEPTELDRAVVRDVLEELMPGREARTVSIALEEYMTEARAEAKAETLLRQLRRRFGEVPPMAAARVRAAGGDRLDIWLDRVIDAPTLDAVLAEP